MMTKKRLSDPKNTRFLGADQIDDVGQALLVVTRELWVVMDRLSVLEKLLEQHGIPAGAVDAYEPDEAHAAELDQRRKKLVATVVAALDGSYGER